MTELPDVFQKEVLKRWLSPTDTALLARVGRACKVAVASDVITLRFRPKDFLWSYELLAWARANGCPWRGGAG